MRKVRLHAMNRRNFLIAASVAGAAVSLPAENEPGKRLGLTLW